MKIINVETYKYWIDWCNWLFVKISTDEGLYGWGEGSLHGAIQSVETAIHELSVELIGKDPSGVKRHWQAMRNAWRWRGGPIYSTALAALDIALWDIEGKRLGVPIYRLLGGPLRPHLQVYASHWLEGVKTAEDAYNGAKEAVSRGFKAFKWNPFDVKKMRENESYAIKHATELMAAAREGAGEEVEIFVDCGECLSPRTTIFAAKAFEPYRPGFFEEPIPFENAKVMVQLAKKIPIPIATGERLLSRWEYLEIIESGGCAIIQPDIMHGAGITEVIQIASMADSYYISVAPHNPGGPICTLAAMHLSASIPNFYILEQMEKERSLRNKLCTNPIEYKDGFFELPEIPGIGTDLNLKVLKDFKFKPQPVSGSSESIWR